MREYICRNCKKKFLSDREKKYCSARCNKTYKQREYRESLFACRFNEAVFCSQLQCETCGWNPEVEKKRREKVFSAFGLPVETMDHCGDV